LLGIVPYTEQVELFWPVTRNGGDPITKYNIYRSLDQNAISPLSSDLIATVVPSMSSSSTVPSVNSGNTFQKDGLTFLYYKDTKIMNGTKYKYFIGAVNSLGETISVYSRPQTDASIASVPYPITVQPDSLADNLGLNPDPNISVEDTRAPTVNYITNSDKKITIYFNPPKVFVTGQQGQEYRIQVNADDDTVLQGSGHFDWVSEGSNDPISFPAAENDKVYKIRVCMTYYGATSKTTLLPNGTNLAAIGAGVGSIVPGVGTVLGTAVGSVAQLALDIFGGKSETPTTNYCSLRFLATAHKNN
jgi:hypothetical protein